MEATTTKPKFKPGDMIQCAGTPHLLWRVEKFENGTYTLSPPDPDADWVDMPQAEVDRFYVKAARAFKRELADKTAEAATPGFDKDGFPTFEDEHR